MGNITIISKKYLDDSTKYSYCPHCLVELQNDGKDFKNILKPLVLIKTKEALKNSDGSFTDYYDEHYECQRCGLQRITTNTFVNTYCCRSDGTKYNEPPKEPGTVWSKEQNKLVPAKWNSVNQRWEEIKEEK